MTEQQQAAVMARIDEWARLLRSAHTADDILGATCFGSFLFGAEMILKDLGLADLAEAASWANQS